MTMTTSDPDVLTVEQRQRCEALKVAREVLINRTITSAQAPDALDMHSIAVYIVTGEDPWGNRAHHVDVHVHETPQMPV